MQTDQSTALPSLRRHLVVGLLGILFLVGCFGGWMALAHFSGAIVAPGTIVVDGNAKKVQHPVGGVVGQIFVRDGSRVAANQLLLKLDENVIRSNLAIVTKTLDQTMARLARLEAERDEQPETAFPVELLDRRLTDPELALALDSEERLFRQRQMTREGQKSQLRQRIGQLEEEINGATAQLDSTIRQNDIMKTELLAVQDLYDKNLVPLSRVSSLQREAARLLGQAGSITASRAQARGRITETELQILQIDQEHRSEVARDLREAQGRISEYIERRVAAQDQLTRTDIRSPQAGVVHQLTAHTIGGVIQAGDPIMLIVPDEDDLAVEVKVSPRDIDQVFSGQQARIQIQAFNHNTTPELNGSVSLVPADATIDSRLGLSSYLVRVSLPTSEIARLGALKLMPGMPVNVFIRTNDRTVLSYLVKPLADQMGRALRER